MKAFQSVQKAMTDHIRRPQGHAGPEGVEERRLKIYRELFYNNIESFIASGFPVLRKLYRDDHWHAMVRDFMSCHLCASPYFLEIAEEFLAYLSLERDTRPEDPAFLLELAHYEWVELALDIAQDDPAYPQEPLWEPMQTVITLSPLAWPLAYRYPVHKLGPAYQPDTPPEHATCLLVYRNRTEQVQFMEINLGTFRLLELLQSKGPCTGEALIRELAGVMGHPQPDKLVDFGEKLLKELSDSDIILPH